MQTWPIQDAKARFSELVQACINEGPQMVTRRRTEAAVLVSVDEWRRLQAASRPSLKALLLQDAGRVEFLAPPRGRAHPSKRIRPALFKRPLVSRSGMNAIEPGHQVGA